MRVMSSLMAEGQSGEKVLPCPPSSSTRFSTSRTACAARHNSNTATTMMLQTRQTCNSDSTAALCTCGYKLPMMHDMTSFIGPLSSVPMRAPCAALGTYLRGGYTSVASG